MWDAVKSSAVVALGASEEEPEVKPCNPNGRFTVCWDPLDGSSIVDNNWAVGTMIGIWSKESGSGEDGLLGATGRDQVTALIAIYGPRTTVLVGLDDGVYEFSYGCTPDGCQLPDGTFEPWICSRKQIKINPDTRIFSPPTCARVTRWRATRSSSTTTWTRATPSATPAVSCPTCTSSSPRTWASSPTPPRRSPPPSSASRSRRPLRPPRREAGGKTSDGVTGGSVLDVQINAVDQRTPALHRLRQRGRPLQRAGPRK